MKKVLIFCLILLCTLSVFAADVSAKVKVYLSYGSDGFGFSSNKGTWEPVIVLATGGDKAGASFSWCPIDLQNSNYGFNVWICPKETFLLTIGSNFSVNFVEDFTFNNFMAYGIVGYNESGYSWNTDSKELTSGSLVSSGVNTQLGFGYQPESVSDFSNADVFISGYFNYLNTEIGTFHFDGVTKLNVVNNKPSLDYSLSEVSFNRFVDSEKNICVENPNTDRIVAINKKFNFDEAYYFDHESRDEEQDWKVGAFKSGFIAGLRYKYFTDADKTVYNGLYGYGLGSYALKDSVSFEVEAEVGRYDAELEVESRGLKNQFTEKVYSLYEFDWVNGKVEAAMTDFYAKYIYSCERFTPYVEIDFENLKTNTADVNGIYICPGLTTWIGSCAIDAGATVGFDSLKNFKWNVQSSFEVNY